MLFRKTVTLYIILLLSSFATAQTALPEKESKEKTDKLRTDAVTFLRETLADVNSMRSVENRISFTSELAALMWFHDEREARSMYVGVIGQFKDLIAKYESRMNEFGPPSDEDEDQQEMPADPFVFDPSDRTRLLRKFTVAMGVRQQIVMSMAEHDADLAINFYYDTMSMVANPALRDQIGTKDSSFETQLISQIAERNPEKAAKLGSKALEGGISFQHIDLLKKIYAKDAERGRELALAMLSSAKDRVPETYLLSSFLDFAGETLEESKKPGGKRAILMDAEVRELAEVLAQIVLNSSGDDPGLAVTHLPRIRKYLPARAAQIRARFKVGRSSSSNTNAVHIDGPDDGEPDFDGAIVTSGANSSAAVRRREEREKAEKQLFDDVQSMTTKQLPKEERNRIVEQARKIIAATPGRDKKITALSMLAAQVAKLGDKELASEVMRDAERLVNPAPKNFQDFMLSWLLVSGYAAADPEKAFPILEETIGRANETLAAFIKIGEFIDINEDYIVDGELQVGAFGGQMIKGFTRELNRADSTIDVLAKADFNKTKNVTNRFERVEVRMLAKMMVLRTILSPKAAAPSESVTAPVATK